MISVSAPGKLYIAGEYAVVEPGHHAVLVAVDRFITVRVTLAEHAGHIISDLYATRSLTWRRRLEDDVLEVEEQFDDYVVSAIRVVEQMVREAGGTMQFFDLEVSSELGDDSGRKLGLGSSSAVTVATVRAAAGFYGLPLDDLAVYKLALLASYAVQPIGSGGDIAASTFTGWVGYTSPDRAWLRKETEKTNARDGLSRLVTRQWPLLEIRRLPAPELRLHVGWTGAPASTPGCNPCRNTCRNTRGNTCCGARRCTGRTGRRPGNSLGRGPGSPAGPCSHQGPGPCHGCDPRADSDGKGWH